MRNIRYTELHGKQVLSQDGRELGEVDDLILDHEEWHVHALIVKLERDLLEDFHMKKPMFGTQILKVSTGFVSGVSDKVILHKTMAELIELAREGGSEPPEAEEPQEA
ncbi:MAG: PRC-barrel domain-containing protein [Sandaracinaceae bacterium]